MKNILKLFAIIGVTVTSLLIILLILEVINSQQLQEFFLKTGAILGILTVASIAVMLINFLGEKKN